MLSVAPGSPAFMAGMCVRVCGESLPVKEGGRERVHCTMSQRK